MALGFGRFADYFSDFSTIFSSTSLLAQTRVAV
jgi:hypothetical protein